LVILENEIENRIISKKDDEYGEHKTRAELDQEEQ
jgi:hypothetical protein